MPKEINFKEIIVKSKKYPKLSVSLNWECGEGYSEYYNPDDPTDAPLLRFDVLMKDDQLDNGSYCTLLKATDNRILLRRIAKYILSEAEDHFNGKETTGNFKRIMEELSWSEIDNGEYRIKESTVALK
jgi:hypothetical protein